ncbi:hypothetical protein AJ80_01239 [Polytolypa hystricis UAMH7299]|uniref:Nephrocystin 3-like N-terminal domain-containing protein n=1 Tax=Polytolypa hystricis (strain UAMH7299) TaxID=1447883 RepID=A0A2B7Z1D6_POLH7|nr:hypothetical protein AJ80_01239 [Polytolypa hystricis UAMH7299]
METLNSAASVLTVLRTAQNTAKACYAYGLETASFPQELPKLREEIEALAPFKGKVADSKTLRGVEGLLDLCQAELTSLQEKITLPKTPQGAVDTGGIVQALQWPLKQEDVEKSFTKKRNFNGSLNVALAADQVEMTHEIKKEVCLVQDAVTKGQQATSAIQKDITKLVNGFTSSRKEINAAEIRAWLKAPDPSLNHNAARESCEPGTGEWFIKGEEFLKWKDDPDQFIWIHGIPGCRKTILASTIIQHIRDQFSLDTTASVAYFYFDFNDGDKQQHESLYLSKKERGYHPSDEELLVTLKRIVEEQERVFVILDALDECTDRERLLKAIKNIAGWKTGKLHMLMTSRREKDIEDEFDSAVAAERISMQNASVDDDIRLYVHERIHTDPKLSR